ncbi:rab-GTPase-TBC domain-containing protein [Vararia minispora EC-137]|uniref:Rab-GTPase-TBC domain-containing protein n=1 Tax=Vararia minispora EC-137 TaxID=1314806 RepID=A0ACB8QY64_9AGAM|nr:rab-GTPase-TBC domain-containing protein [Vararia minispora EC-137]
MSASTWKEGDDHLKGSTNTHPNLHTDDDAFADGDDDSSYGFSSEVIRADVAYTLSLSPVEGHGVEDAASSPRAASDVSMSMLDVNGNGRSSLGSSWGSSSLPSTSRQSSLKFEQISLDNDQRDKSTVSMQEHLADDDQTPHSPSPATHASLELHAVVIDVSQRHPVPIEIHSVSEGGSDTSPRTAAHSAEPSRRSEEPPSFNIAPSISHAKSTSDLPLPPLSAAPSGRLSTSHHKPSRSQGPSVFEQVVSKTRPSFLPPKKKEEDIKHLHDWEQMMKRSRAAEEKRRKALEERRLAREGKVEESLHIWEKDVVPNWKAVRDMPRLRRLWWSGIPVKLRATMWEHAVGNSLALSKDSYRTCLSRAKRAQAAGTFPTTTLSLIETDMSTTLPRLHIFSAESGPMYEDLKDMLCAWVVSRSDEGLGYVPGIAKLAAMILLNMSASQGFITLRNLLERHCMRAFYGGLSTKDDVEAYYRIFDTLLADGMPKIYFNFKQHQISPAAYLPDWILPLFMDHLPFEACARLWDVILLEGDAFLYRASLAVLAVLEPRLGENPAAIAVAKRDGRPLNGGKYEIYGVDEETVWDRIFGMEDWWKESTWQRLLQRELPDL